MLKKIFICIILCLLFLSSCNKTEENKIETKEDNNLKFSNQKDELDKTPDDTKTPNDANTTKSPSKKAYTVNQSNIYNLNDTITIEDVEIKIKDAYYCKTLPESINQQDVHYFPNDLDENGNVKASILHAFIVGSVTNMSNETIEYYINMAELAELDEAGGVTQLSEEARYRMESDSEESTEKSYFMFELEPNETLEFQTMYLIQEGMKQKDLYYVINKDGHGPGYDGLRAVKLGKLGEHK